jgi:glycosyltransferase involved in cell wall biosynthesis
MKVVFLGCTREFGFGFSANITKIGYMAKGLTEAGAACVIHNGIVGSEKITNDQNIEYNGFKVTTYKKRGSQHISWIRNAYRLYRYLKNERVNGDRNIAILELDLYHIMLLYFLMLKILGYKRVVISHEWGPTIVNERRLKYYSHCVFARTFGWFSNGILPISEFIIKKIEHFKKPYFKLPIMADFNEEHEYTPKEDNNFVYCASVYYTRIIKMVIDSYARYTQEGGKIKLTLILNGPDDRKKDIADYIETRQLTERITIKSKLPYKELVNEYLNAKALLIPLDPDYEQDEARFSQKIAEYLSSKSPVISNNVGEIKYYFNDDEIIKCEFNEIGFAKTFSWIAENEDKAKEIGIRGYERGAKEFDYRHLGEEMYDFFNSI